MGEFSCAYAEDPRKAKKYSDIIHALDCKEAYEDMFKTRASIVTLRTRYEPAPEDKPDGT